MTASTLSSWARNVNSSLEDEDDSLPSSPRLPSSAAVDSVLSSREARKRSVHMSSQDAWKVRDSESEPLQASAFRNASTGTTASLTSDQIKSSGRPVSLAHFMGADRTVQGPRLNKVQQASPTEYDKPMGSFMTQNPDLMNNNRFASKERVALPGLAKPSSSASASSPSSPSIAQKPSFPRDTSNEKESLIAPKKSSTLPPTDKSPKLQAKVFATSPATSPLITPKPSFARHDSSKDSPKPDVMPKKSHTIPQVAPKPALPTEPSSTPRTTPSKPWLSSPKPSYSPAQRTKSFEKAPTASLTKLKASNIVRDRLQWGEEQAKDASPPVSAKNTPKRGNVMERWGRDASSSAPASPVVGQGQKKQFSLPVAATPASFTAPSSPVKDHAAQNGQNASSSANSGEQTAALSHPTRDRARGPRKSTLRTTAVLPSSTPPTTSNSPDMTMKDFLAKQKANPPLPMPQYDEPSNPSRIDTLKATWQNQGPIASRSLPTPPTRVSEEPVRTAFRNRVALPGMTRPAPEPTATAEQKHSIPFKPSSPPLPAKAEFDDITIPMEMNNDLLHWANQQVEDLPPPLSDDAASSSDDDEAPEDLEKPRSSEPTIPELLQKENVKQDDKPSWASSNFKPKPKANIEKTANRVSWIKPARAAPQPASPPAESKSAQSEMISIPAFEPESFPSIDLDRLRETPRRQDFGTSLSTDVLLINDGSSRSLGEGEKSTFYDSELLLIVHRAKKNALATSHLYLWRGSAYTPSDADQSKVDELSSRYRTEPIEAHQGEEMPEFYTLLGPRLISRNGSRKDFDSMNTCLYRVRGTPQQTTLIDEVPLAASSVCSAFSYILAFAGSFVLWNGQSASGEEQKAARTFVNELAEGAKVTEERESSEQIGLFWQIVGVEEYSSSILWRRKQGALPHPKIYSVEAHASTHICPVTSISESSISLIDTGLELWTVVPREARADRHNINFALTLAKNLSTTASPRQPAFVVICPSLVPVDLQSALRVTNWRHLNGASSQDQLQMNVLSLEEAEEQLKARSLPRAAFSDPLYLPLGFDKAP